VQELFACLIKVWRDPFRRGDLRSSVWRLFEGLLPNNFTGLRPVRLRFHDAVAVLVHNRRPG
jgi:hypothetical protein